MVVYENAHTIIHFIGDGILHAAQWKLFGQNNVGVKVDSSQLEKNLNKSSSRSIIHIIIIIVFSPFYNNPYPQIVSAIFMAMNCFPFLSTLVLFSVIFIVVHFGFEVNFVFWVIF